MDVAEVIRTVATVIGSGGVVVAARAYRHTREQARIAFEDALAREYREIAGTLPAAAFHEHGRVELTKPEQQSLFRYFDLSNEQLRLINEGRIRDETAAVWRSGIRQLMDRETFQAEWTALRPDLPKDFFTSLSAELEATTPLQASVDDVGQTPFVQRRDGRHAMDLPRAGEQSQNVTRADLEAGRIRVPQGAKRHFPSERSRITVTVRGQQFDDIRWDPRLGPDRERSGVLGFGKGVLDGLVDVGDSLSVTSNIVGVSLD